MTSSSEIGINKPVVHIVPMGNIANRMVQYMIAHRIAARVDGCLISNAMLSEWGIELPALSPSPGASMDVSGHRIDTAELIRKLSTREVARINLSAYGQWVANFPDRETCGKLFVPGEHDLQGYGPDYLVCNVRGSETLDARHADYTLLPIDFYEDLASETGLKLVFLGQIADNAYCNELRRRFPAALFCESRGAIADFQVLRNSQNLVLAVSTFSWLAAWLSQAQMIVLPVNGIFNPMQRPDIDLIPPDDRRYKYYLFPINYSIPVNRVLKGHRTLNGTWRLVRPEMICDMRASAPRWPKTLDRFLAAFDEKFYLRTYGDVARAIQAGGLSSGRAHFVTNGFAENRQAFPFDSRWYSSQYPMAAIEVAQGDYADLQHHYTEVGILRGYTPVPIRGRHCSSAPIALRSGRVLEHGNLDPLSRLAIRHGTDKFGAHQYTPHYHRLFVHLRECPIRLLEIGIGGYGMPLAGGQSLAMWADYFPYGRIIGLDLQQKRIAIPPRSTLVQGSQTDTALLDRVCREHGPFDIIIDDGSHQVNDVLASFHYLYPLMAADGLYIVEDTQTALWSETGGSPDGRATIFDLAHLISLSMHELEVRAKKSEPIKGTYGDITSSVQVLRNMIIFERGSNTYPSNAAFSTEHHDVRLTYDILAKEAARDPSPGVYLTRIDLANWAGRADLGVSAAEEGLKAYPDRADIVLAAIRAMERAGKKTECLALSRKLISLFPGDPAAQSLLERFLVGD
jgi:hypothetical protein